MPEARLHRGLASGGLGRTDEADELLRPLAAERARSDCGPAALELATIQLAGHHPEDALATLERCTRALPRKVRPCRPCSSARPRRCRNRNRSAEAEARFLKVAEAFPDDAWADDAMLRAAQSALAQA